jgi:hypothetical protein
MTDKERYLWIRKQISDDMQWYLLGRTVQTPQEFDEAIDEAAAKESGEPGWRKFYNVLPKGF